MEGDFRYVDSGAFDECTDFLAHLDGFNYDWEKAFSGWIRLSKTRKEDRKLSQNYWGPWNLVKVLKISVILIGKWSQSYKPFFVLLHKIYFLSTLQIQKLSDKVTKILGQRQKGVIARSILLTPGGPLACELARHSVILKVNDWIFCHGGLLPQHGKI